MLINDLEMNRDIGASEAASIFGGAGASPVLVGAKATVGGALVVGSYKLGNWAGEQIDKEYGLSDKISDWGAENIPWPW